MSKVGYRCPFARKSVLHDFASAAFLPKSHARTMFSPSFHVHQQGRVPMPVLHESPFYTMLPHAAFFGQNHMRAPCFRPVFMYMSKVGCRCPFCPKVRFTRCCPTLRFLA